MLVEVCANSLQSAINAEKAGADRIELCSELAVGGITPSYGLLKAVKKKITIPVRVLIRPRSGDFSYSTNEFDIMKTNIEICAKMGFDGIAIGMLDENFNFDEDLFKKLIAMNHGLKTTLHRAFDWVRNPFLTLEQVERLGVDTILTSGQQKKAIDGMAILQELNKKAMRTTIMPGSGINASNAHVFKEKGFKAIHLSGVRMNKRFCAPPKISMNYTTLLSDNSLAISNFETIKKVVHIVK